jgi:restriction endonuclease S subunit
LQQAQEKQAEKDRQVDERDQQIKQLIQLLQSKGLDFNKDLVEMEI